MDKALVVCENEECDKSVERFECVHDAKRYLYDTFFETQRLLCITQSFRANVIPKELAQKCSMLHFRERICSSSDLDELKAWIYNHSFYENANSYLVKVDDGNGNFPSIVSDLRNHIILTNRLANYHVLPAKICVQRKGYISGIFREATQDAHLIHVSYLIPLSRSTSCEGMPITDTFLYDIATGCVARIDSGLHFFSFVPITTSQEVIYIQIPFLIHIDTILGIDKNDLSKVIAAHQEWEIVNGRLRRLIEHTSKTFVYDIVQSDPFHYPIHTEKFKTHVITKDMRRQLLKECMKACEQNLFQTSFSSFWNSTYHINLNMLFASEIFKVLHEKICVLLTESEQTNLVSELDEISLFVGYTGSYYANVGLEHSKRLQCNIILQKPKETQHNDQIYFYCDGYYYAFEECGLLMIPEKFDFGFSYNNGESPLVILQLFYI